MLLDEDVSITIWHPDHRSRDARCSHHRDEQSVQFIVAPATILEYIVGALYNFEIEYFIFLFRSLRNVVLILQRLDECVYFVDFLFRCVGR